MTSRTRMNVYFSPDLLKQVKAGDKVRFDAEKVNGQMTVTGIAKVNEKAK